MRRTLLRAALVALIIGVAACSSHVDAPQLGVYRAVRSIHTGFAGPATGRHHDEYVKEFSEQVERLLTESGG